MSVESRPRIRYRHVRIRKEGEETHFLCEIAGPNHFSQGREVSQEANDAACTQTHTLGGQSSWTSLSIQNASRGQLDTIYTCTHKRMLWRGLQADSDETVITVVSVLRI